MERKNPSPFYNQLVGAEKFSLMFPLSEDCAGPSWLESGELLHSGYGDGEIETEDIEAVSLGWRQSLSPGRVLSRAIFQLAPALAG